MRFFLLTFFKTRRKNMSNKITLTFNQKLSLINEYKVLGVSITELSNKYQVTEAEIKNYVQEFEKTVGYF